MKVLGQAPTEAFAAQASQATILRYGTSSTAQGGGQEVSKRGNL